MTAAQLYEELKRRVTGDRLQVRRGEIEGKLDNIFRAFHTDVLCLRACTVKQEGQRVDFGGNTSLAGPKAAGAFKASITVDHERFTGTVTLSCVGKYMLKDFFPKVSALADCPYSRFLLSYPVMYGELASIHKGMEVTGTAEGSSAEACWEPYRGLLGNRLKFHAFYYEDIRGNGLVNIDFQTDSPGIFSVVHLSDTFAPVSVCFSIRMRKGEFSETPRSLYLCMVEMKKPAMKLQIPMFVHNRLIKASAYISPALSVKNVADFLFALFHIETADSRNLMPEDAFLSSFGLKYVGIYLENNWEKPMAIKQVEGAFAMSRPWSTPVPNLTLDDFQVTFEASRWNADADKPIVTGTVFAAASVKLGSYMFTGDIKGYMPQMFFEGRLALFRQESKLPEQDGENMSLAELANTCGAPLPEQWKGNNLIFSLLVSADAGRHILQISAHAEDILTIHIGDLPICLESLGVGVTVAPSGIAFGIDGSVSFGSGDSHFALFLSAQYDREWRFQGYLEQGTVKIGALLTQMFQLQESVISKTAVDIELDDLSFSYESGTGRLELYASFRTCWFQVLGYEPELGGNIRLIREEQNNVLKASAAMYVEIDRFMLLVQADDFYRDDRSFLFRLMLDNKYLQGVYSKNADGDEIITISMGGITLGEIVQSLVRVINPNSRSRLPKPWDVLYRISLSAFSLVCNVTQKTITFWIDIGLNIAGIIQIDKIGLAYENGKLQYVMTGSALAETYDQKEPLSWDAINGAPPVPGTQKTKLYFVCMGQHLDIKPVGEGIPDIIKSLSEQLGSSTPSVGYGEENGFLFALDFVIADMFRFKAVFMDPELYGGQIVVSASQDSPVAVLNGLQLELLYKKISDDVGMFACTVIVPKKFSVIRLGAVTFYIGKIHVEIYTNGSFLIDLGFPHNGDFSQSFGLEFGIYTGRGGFYIGVLKGDAVKSVPKAVNGSFSPVVLFGIGISAGLGRSFDLGIVKGGVSLMLTGIFEGVLGIFHASDQKTEAIYYRVKAMAGISGSLFLSVDLKIITISASARVSAACMVTLESYQDSVVEVELALELSACIKILFIKIKFSFSFHQTASFRIAGHGQAPWKLADAQQQNRKFRQRFLRDGGGAAELFPVKKLGGWQVSVRLVPLVSVTDPTELQKEYCMALIGTMEEEDFYKIVEMLLAWLLCIEEGKVYADTVDRLASEDIWKLSLEVLYGFLQKNIELNIGIELEGKESTGVAYPMPSQLALQINDTVVSYGNILVEESYLEELTAYFARLNADPSHKPENSIHTENTKEAGDQIALNDCMVLDYYCMLLSELLARLKTLYKKIVVQADDLGACVSLYGADFGEVLKENPELKLSSVLLPRVKYLLSREDTLEGLQKLCMASVWDDLSGQNSLLCLGRSLETEVEFDNKSAGMTAEQAAAVFYVRYSTEDILYVRQARRVAEEIKTKEKGGMPESEPETAAEWECEIPFSMELDLGLPSPYVVLAGDTVVRIAKVLALLEGAHDSEEWKRFRQKFLEENGQKENEVPERYHVHCSTVISEDKNIESLYRRIYPDFREEPCKRGLWKEPIFQPMRDIVLREVRAEEGSLKNLLDVYGEEAVAAAAREGRITLNGKQEVCIPLPQSLPVELVREKIMPCGKEMGAMVSRFFLQGIRLPKPESQGEQKRQMLPMYELLQQQFALDMQQSLRMKIWLEDGLCEWIFPDTEEVIRSREQIEELLPAEVMPQIEMPRVMPHCAGRHRCQSLFDMCTLDGKDCLAWLPESFREELKEWKPAPKLLCGGQEREYQWVSTVDIAVKRTGENVYRVQGAAAGDRLYLEKLKSMGITGLDIAYYPSVLSSAQNQLFCVPRKACRIIKTNLSVQTHMGPVYAAGRAKRKNGPEDLYEYSAGLENETRFLELLWQCSVIGGGFWMYCEGMPAEVFGADGTGCLKLIARLPDFETAKKAANGIFTEGKYDSYTLWEEDARVYVPAYPAGCVGLEAELSQDRELEELYQMMSYAVCAGGEKMESAPVLPQKRGEKMVYPFCVPVYKLVDDKNVYSGIGKEFLLEIGLRDVLGNYVKTGELTIRGEYNDELLSLGEYPYTKAFYTIADTEEGIKLSITVEYKNETDFSQTQTGDIIEAGQKGEIQEQTLAKAQTAMQQLACKDIRVSVQCSMDNVEYEFSQEQLDRLRQYTGQLYRELSEKASGDIKKTHGVETQEFEILLQEGEIQEIYPLSVQLKIQRTGCECLEDERIRHVAAMLSPAETMHETAKIGATVLGEGADGIYGIPPNFIQKLSVAPYEYHNKRTPHFYALKPFALSPVTRSLTVVLPDGQKKECTYQNCDLNAWMFRFLDDMETMLGGREVCHAANVCPGQLDELVKAKKRLGTACAGRVEALCEEFAGSQQAGDMFREHYMADLTNVQRVDLVASYRSDFKTGKMCRAEIALFGSDVFYPEKLSAAEPEFCLYSYRSLQENTKEELTMALKNIEYNILSGEEYDSSQWIRLNQPLTSTDLHLEADYGMPHPLTECPDAPAFVRQWCTEALLDGETGSARQKLFRFPYWDYHLEVCCIPRKQYTLYIKLRFGKEINRMFRSPKEDLFDVLAAYDCGRDDLLKKLRKEEWEASYSSMVSIANRAAEALSGEVQNENAVSDEGAVLAVTFYKNGKPALEVKEVTSVLAGLKIVPKIHGEPEDTTGERIRFVLTLEGISIYECNEIQSFGYMVQNEDLFAGNGLHMRREFIVTSQEIGMKAIKMQPRYRIKIEAESVEAAVRQVWDRLRLSAGTVQAEIEVNFCFDVTGNQIGLRMKMPVTLSLGGESMEEFIDHIAVWLTEHGYKPGDGQLEFTANVYDSMNKKLFEAVLES